MKKVQVEDAVGMTLCHDITPTAIRELGAEIVSYGVPAQPGNTFDVLLTQLFTGDRLTERFPDRLP